jgi:hypothetical protein
MRLRYTVVVLTLQELVMLMNDMAVHDLLFKFLGTTVNTIACLPHIWASITFELLIHVVDKTHISIRGNIPM